MICIENGNRERRIHVPWMFLDEWKRAYEDIYSKDIELQKRGYERLLLWKARQGQLPAGVDCTLELIHVHIIDEEVTQQISTGVRPNYVEHDIQLMCSAAITRYLNHISNVVKTNEDSLYKMAEKLNIPNWLVLLRHDSAHSSTLPSLSVLRMAVNFALDWLHENYWKLSASIPSLVFSKTKSHFSEKHIGKILDVWQSVRMYQMNGYRTIHEITDEYLRKSLMKVLQNRSQEDNEESSSSENSSTLPYVIQHVRDKLFRALKGDRSRSEKLIAMLLQCKTFIPPAHFIADGDKELTSAQILTWISMFWENFLVPLQENFSLFPNLIHKLVVMMKEEKSKHIQLVMALWIQQLCISMLKSRAVIKEAYNFPDNIIEKDINFRMEKKEILKPRINIHPKAKGNVEKKYPHLRNGFFALQNDEKGNSCPLSDVTLAVFNPNEFTMIFLPSLMDVASPELSERRKRLLGELVSIAVNTTDLGLVNKDEPIHTVEEFSQKEKKKKIQLNICSENQSKHEEEFASEFDWATCPLGILPWQKESPVKLDIPSHITWELSENPTPNLSVFKTQIPLAQEKVNWPAIVKNNSFVRAKLKKKKLVAKKIKKASQHLLSSLALT